MRLIDADALMEKLHDEKKHKPIYAPFKLCTADSTDLKFLLAEEPTIEAEPVKHGKLRIEITTDDFKDIEMAKENGWHRKKFFCPFCDQLIKTETWDKHRMFGGSSILKTNETVNYCPNCGAKMDEEV